MGAALWVLGERLAVSEASQMVMYVIAVLYMPLPMIAGLVVERMAKRRTLLADEGRRLLKGLARVAIVSASVCAMLYVALMVATAVLGNAMALPGVGRLVFSADGVIGNLSGLVPGGSADVAQMAQSMPPVALLYVLALVSGLLAGFTVNGLFAFGEEYGWRGVLMEELRPLGAVKANVLTGVLWGVWHAPLIMLGFNYPGQPVAGVVAMVAWVVPLSFILWRAREYSGSVAAPAIIHGAFNASAGFYIILVADRSSLVAAPVGAVAALAITVCAIAVWRVFGASQAAPEDDTNRRPVPSSAVAAR